MSEPHSSTVGAVAVAAIGPLLGDYSIILFASLAGGLWALASNETLTRTQGAWLLMRLVSMAFVFAGSAAWAVDSQLHLPATHALAPVSFLIAAVGNRWQQVFDALGAALARLFGTFGGRQP